MLLRYIKSQVGSVLDNKGLDIRGRKLEVPYILNGSQPLTLRFGGILNSSDCDSLEIVKLVGFTSYSLDEGKTWINLDPDTCLVGVKKWREVYVVLFDGLPRTLAHSMPVSKYSDNVVPIRPLD